MDERVLLRALAEPFAADEIKWRVGHTRADKASGLALAYIDARAVEDRLDEVCGAGWRCSYPHVVRSSVEGRRGSVVVCEISVKVGAEWVSRANGAGDTAVEAEKGALSDAFKRAATLWGVGRYLYGFPSPWVDVVPAGKSYQIARSEYPRLAQLSVKALADYRADPSGFRAPPDEEEPARPAFQPAAAPPQRPAEPARAAPVAPSGDLGRLVAALRACSTFEALSGALVAGAAQLGGEPLATFRSAHVDLLLGWIERYAEDRNADGVESVARYLAVKAHRPDPVDEPRIRAVLDKARREARGT